MIPNSEPIYENPPGPNSWLRAEWMARTNVNGMPDSELTKTVTALQKEVDLARGSLSDALVRLYGALSEWNTGPWWKRTPPTARRLSLSIRSVADAQGSMLVAMSRQISELAVYAADRMMQDAGATVREDLGRQYTVTAVAMREFQSWMVAQFGAEARQNDNTARGLFTTAQAIMSRLSRESKTTKEETK
jgi:hypothetical protein